MNWTDFATNLRYLTAEKGTGAQLCREIGLNQQQFSKYLSGRSRPSARTLRKLSRYLEVEDVDLLRPHADLLAVERRRARVRSGEVLDPFADAFPGDLRNLRRFLGAYQTFYTSPAAPGTIVRAAAFLDERSGIVLSRTMENSRTATERPRQWTRCNGKAAFHGDRLFVIDFEAQNGGSFMLTTLLPPHRIMKNLLFGVASFLASHPRRMPFTSRVVWKRFEDFHTVRELLETCAFIPDTTGRVEPAIKDYLRGSGDVAEPTVSVQPTRWR